MLHLHGIDSEVHSADTLGDAKLIYSSHELPSRDRVAIWNEVVWRNYVPLQIKIAPHDDFAGQVALNQLGGVRVVTSGSRAQCITRTPKLIAQDSEEYLMLGLQLKGAAIIEQHEKGEISLLDYVSLSEIEVGDFVYFDNISMGEHFGIIDEGLKNSDLFRVKFLKGDKIFETTTKFENIKKIKQ